MMFEIRAVGYSPNFASQGALAPVVTTFSMTDASSNPVAAVIIANGAITGGAGVTLIRQ